MTQEIEILAPVNTTLAEALKALRVFGEPAVQHINDAYYTHQSIPLIQTNEDLLYGSLRIREKNGKFILTVKKDEFENGQWLYSDEHEVEVANKTEAHAVLAALGFCVAATLTTTRHAYRTHDFEIVLDNVQELGVFLEVEAKTAGEPRELKHKVRAFLRSLPLPLGEELTIGKYELALRKTEKANK